jgi:hypothetical protein
MVEKPDGDLVPDVRQPFFHLPSWVEDVFPPEECTDEQDSLLNSRYKVTKALSFSNTGGVYVAEDQNTSTEVIIKEARPYTLMSGDGLDARVLLRREGELLGLLEATGFVPKPLEVFDSWENTFLVQEYLSGVDLRTVMLGNTPLLRVHPSAAESEEYFATYRSIMLSFIDGLSKVHEQGIVFGDLSATNMKVDPVTHKVTLIDFEGAYRPGTDEPIELYTPGFRRSGLNSIQVATEADDLYGLASIMLYMIFPIAALGSLRRDLFTSVLPLMLRDIGWGRSNLHSLIAGLADNAISLAAARDILAGADFSVEAPYSESPLLPDLDSVIDQLGIFLFEHMDVESKSLFPVDPFAHRTNRSGLGFGASGVLFALKSCGMEVPLAGRQWLCDRCAKFSSSEVAPGLLTGAAGIAWSLSALGEDSLAKRLMDMANASSLQQANYSYLYGMAGIGMANIHMYQEFGDQRYLDQAFLLADHLLRAAKENETGIFWKDGANIHIGLGYGQSGVALFLLRLSEQTGDQRYRAIGEKALAFDLAQAQELEPGLHTFPRAIGEHHTTLPYIEEGGAGIAKVAMRYGKWKAVEPILGGLSRKYAAFSGLLFGLSGFVDTLTDASILTGNSRYLEMAKKPISGLDQIYLIRESGGIFVPGDGLLRVSCDYGTGVAGVMRSLFRYRWSDKADFFLDPPKPK